MSDTRQDPGLGARDSGLETQDSGFGIRDSRNTTPVDLDAAIDTVARQMTEGEPSGALRARVLDEIVQDRRHALAVPRWAWAGAAAAVLVAVATSVWLVRPAPQPGGEPSSTVAQRPATAERVPTANSGPAPSAASSSAAAAPSARQVSVRLADRDVEEPPPESHLLPALAEIEPLRFASIEPVPLQLAGLEVASLTAVPSIEIPSLEWGSNEIQSADPKKENRP